MKLKFFLFIGLLSGLSSSYSQSTHKTKNVVVILIDGYRWQELFHGADFDLPSSSVRVLTNRKTKSKKSGIYLQSYKYIC